MREILGDVIIWIGLFFVSVGMLGIYSFRDFYIRSLVAANVDTVGFFTIIIGLCIKSGINWFSLKLIFLAAITMIINPVVTHSIVRSAYISGSRIRKE